ncbi:hypothetical protein RB200_42270 [Streptomyces sp. PmtG]
MNPYLVLAVAAAEWDRVAARLDGAPRERLAALLADVRREGADETLRRAAAEDAAGLLRERLPEEFGGAGPAGEQGRLVLSVPDAGSDPHPVHHGYVAEDLAVLLVDGHRMVGPVLGPVRDRLLAAPAWDAAAVRRRGGRPDAPGLIRLPGVGGRARLPRFQFAGDARPLPVVVEVNTVLEADRDPWGAADWWLSGNAWLGDRPASLLGTGGEARLADTARLLMEED